MLLIKYSLFCVSDIGETLHTPDTCVEVEVLISQEII